MFVVVVLVVVQFCCSSCLAFVIMADHINLMRNFSLIEVFAFEAIFLFIHKFFEKYLKYRGLLSVLIWICGVEKSCANAHYWDWALFRLFQLEIQTEIIINNYSKLFAFDFQITALLSTIKYSKILVTILQLSMNLRYFVFSAFRLIWLLNFQVGTTFVKT